MSVVKESFDHECSKSIDVYSGRVHWKLFYKKDYYLHLQLVSGAPSADIYYCVHVDIFKGLEKTTRLSSGSIKINQQEEIDLKIAYQASKRPEGRVRNFSQVYQPKTYLDLYIIRLYPFISVPYNNSTLTADLYFTLNSDKGFNDVTLFFGSEKKPVVANKFMLAARSPVFKTMFESGMKEAKSNEVEIEDISIDVGKEMVSYIYTDRASLGVEKMKELWFAAEKYQLSGLKALCENRLVDALDTSNAAQCLLFAGRYSGDGPFKEHVLSFISRDKDTCSNVMRSPEWQDLKTFSPELALAVSEKFFDISAEPDTKRPKIMF